MTKHLERRRTCDRVRSGELCGRPAPHALTGSVGDREYDLQACERCRDEVQAALLAAGWSVTHRDREEGRRRAVYVSASGIDYTAAEARPWLVERGLAPEGNGRLSKSALEAYGKAH